MRAKGPPPFVLSPSTLLRTGLSKHEQQDSPAVLDDGLFAPFDEAQDRLRQAQAERLGMATAALDHRCNRGLSTSRN
jgi:hypothetical protein